MKIHVLTLTWNNVEKLEKLRTGLFEALLTITNTEKGDLNPGFEPSEWYIRDNGSRDNTVEVVSAWNFKADTHVVTNLFEIGHNRDNFAQGVNFLFEKANPKDDDIILLLNDDVLIQDTKSLKYMYDLMVNTGSAIVGARLLYPNGKIQHAGVTFIPKYGSMPYHFRLNEQPDHYSNKNRYFQAVTAAVCLVKASSFRRVEGLNENYQWAFEDIDLCLKIGLSEKIAYCGQTTIRHEESATLRKNPVNKLFMQKNVSVFKTNWWKNGKPQYILDHQNYLDNKAYHEC